MYPGLIFVFVLELDFEDGGEEWGEEGGDDVNDSDDGLVDGGEYECRSRRLLSCGLCSFGPESVSSIVVRLVTDCSSSSVYC